MTGDISVTAVHRELDRLWRARFGEPLPMPGRHDLAREVLERFSQGPASEEERSWRVEVSRP